MGLRECADEIVSNNVNQERADGTLKRTEERPDN